MTVDISSEAVERDEVLADLDRLAAEEGDVLARAAARHIRAQADRIKELEAGLTDALEWIDAVPSDTTLPAMPGFDRDEDRKRILRELARAKAEFQLRTIRAVIEEGKPCQPD